ncbi:MAG: valine--tRNA ligase, partial [Elusimicrobiota bacterium]
KGLVGKSLRLPLTGRDIPVVADEAVESSFGTGAVKVTPAHDPNDFEIGGRHGLPLVKVIGADGKMTAEAGSAYAGLSREKARDKVLEDLKAGEHLRKTDDHRHSVGVCYRCLSAVEPLVSKQWFVRMQDLAAPALKAVEDGRFKIYPESWTKPYTEWLSNIRDWCVSRQIWWGHRIPVWYCPACRDKDGYSPQVGAARPASCPSCRGTALEQDPDVLDTWFSSALWPFSVFGWPEKSADLDYHYPTSVLVTGYEILYLWVARMQMSGLEALGKVPFDHAYIHGIVRDKKGKKMSKSLGNVIDPLVMMDKYGTDALRFSLAVQAHPGKDIPFSEDSITGSRNFANKLWNSTRFVLMNLPETAPEGGLSLAAFKPEDLELCDRWILAEYRQALSRSRGLMKEYEVAAAADVLYGFLWDRFCDWYVELAKIRLQGADESAKAAPRAVLAHVLTGTLKMLHPFMPYITEELYASLKPFVGESADFLLKSGAPDLGPEWESTGAIREMGRLIDVVKALRTLRSEMCVPPGLRISALAEGGESRDRDLLFKYAEYVKFLARLSELKQAMGGERPQHSATAVASGMTFFVPLEGVIDLGKERQRLEKEVGRLEVEAARLSAKLEDKTFMERAPREQVELSRAQHDDAAARLGRLKDVLKSL